MIPDSIEEGWRIANILLASGALFLLVRWMAAYWGESSPVVMLVLLGAVGLLVTTLWSSVENLQQGNPFGWRVPLSTVSCTWIIIAFCWEGRRG